LPAAYDRFCADPDIVMVGEIRDLETAEVAINAALPGT
jgi:type II secretory ATPase GspE/PulE/Tfp pilus assembly ATPase PilB-like protein